MDQIGSKLIKVMNASLLQGCVKNNLNFREALVEMNSIWGKITIYPDMFVTPFRIEIKTFWAIQALNILGYGRAINILGRWRAINIWGHWRVIYILGHWRAINILGTCGAT